ncbi:ABC transporter permease [Labrys sp. LIt4]|uniref:DL-methionine transporter permease subunit n=1 Tax=Labrys okinawensis TaxID=346911 RepID=A0A2S9Q4J2_9HYPH|nr:MULTISPECIES: methionine ABC transporter permease [Labrys]MBP0578521.1 ABC transporter permease [Labrys sp. LIt4]PRH84278.1 DL-methionine transporter permease subunit [Labrys okinawensis]
MSPEILKVIWSATGDSLIMVGVSILFGTILGLPLGIFLATSRRGELLAAPKVNAVLGAIVNAVRSVPFIILIVAIIPFTRLLVGSSIGLKGVIVPLTIAVAPFIARIVESAIREVDAGLIEAARSFGATPFQIIRKVLFPEALPGLVLGLTLTTVSLIGYSAMAGVVGGGGLGDVAIRYGYQRFMPEVMGAVVLILILLVQGVQSAGDLAARKVNKRVRQD